jgi:hypothetical protein
MERVTGVGTFLAEPTSRCSSTVPDLDAMLGQSAGGRPKRDRFELWEPARELA